VTEFDGRQRPIKFVHADGSSATLEYGQNSGNDLFSSSQFAATSFTSSNGQKVETTFDANGRRTAVAQSFGADRQKLKTWTYRYDVAGNQALEIGPDGGKAAHEYDAMNRLIRTVFPNGKSERTLFTSTGLNYATIDASGARKERKFDSAGDPIEEKK